jgi:hypothetical protein
MPALKVCLRICFGLRQIYHQFWFWYSFHVALFIYSVLWQVHYQLIVSTSFLHHLHQPEALWQTVIQHSKPGTKVFIADLCRPASKSAARQMVQQHASGEPDVLQQDWRAVYGSDICR